MHPIQPPTLTFGVTVLNESDDLNVLGGTLDSYMTFKKHLPASQCILKALIKLFKGLVSSLNPSKYLITDRSWTDATEVLFC